MTNRAAGDFDYDRHGGGYAVHRRTDPTIAAAVHRALGPARTVVNVGAGAGSYEPIDRRVVAVEPSAAMRAQRPPGSGPAVEAVAAALPFGDRSFDAAMATVTIHQWPDPWSGLAEMRRVSRGPVVVLTFDGDALDRFWLAEYVPELMAAERTRYPGIEAVRAALGPSARVLPVPVPHDCPDGFTEAYYARPEQFLDPAVRGAQSVWGFLAPGVEERAVRALADDLASGAWDARHGTLRTQPWFESAVRLIVG